MFFPFMFPELFVRAIDINPELSSSQLFIILSYLETKACLLHKGECVACPIRAQQLV